MENKLYKGKYSIVLYNIIENENDMDDIVAMFDSVEEFANYVKKNLHNTYSLLNNNMKGASRNIQVDGRWYELHCVNVVD